MYETTLTYNKKKYSIKIKTIFGIEDNKDHYDLEVATNKRMTGNEFLSLRKYLQEEGYIEEARIYNEEVYLK
jgi:hypothetical protein